MKIYEGVYLGAGRYQGARCKVAGDGQWHQSSPSTWWATVKFPDGKLMNIYNHQLRPLSCDERPSYIESPEQAFSPAPTDHRADCARYVVETAWGVPVAGNLLQSPEVAGSMTAYFPRALTNEELRAALDANRPRYGLTVMVGEDSIQFKQAKEKAEMSKTKQEHQALMAAIQTDLQTVGCWFMTGNTGTKLYTYKVPAGWGTKVGDQLVVQTPSGVAVVEVREVHDVPRLDLGVEYKWAVCKVERAEYDERLRKEEAFLKALADVERATKLSAALKAARESLGTNNGSRRAFEKAVKELQS